MTERSEEDGAPPGAGPLNEARAEPDAETEPAATESETAAAAPVAPEAEPAGPTPGPRARRHRSRHRRHRKRRKAPWWELPLLVAIAIVLAVLVKTFLVQPFYIPSASMEKTLHGCPGCHGDRILVNKPIYDLRDPHPGDIVVFHAPPGWNEEPASTPPGNPVLRVLRGFGQLIGFVPPDGLILVKRVIATGGQTVKGDAAGHVLVSDHGPGGPWRTLHEPYVYEDGPDSHAQFGPVTVPKGRLWVMGDHRNDSADSRFHCGRDGTDGADGAQCDPRTSTVPDHDVIGKAVLIAWPVSRWRTLGTPATFTHDAMSAGGAVPSAVATLVMFPVYVRRRLRRRRRARR
jgi:signal peptidase I